MATDKTDTTRGFGPTVPAGPDIVAPAVASVRLDGRLDRSLLSPSLHQVLLGLARVRNAVSSFRLEGERVELDRAREVLESGKAENASELGVLQLSRSYADIARGRLPAFTISGILEAHRKLFDGVLEPEVVGRFKTVPNVITDPSETIVRFRPTPPDRVQAELTSLLRWIDGPARGGLPPVVASIFFAEFQAIHPFLDGNGRLGRFLNIALLRSLGLENSPLVPLDTRFFRTSDQYYEYLATSNTGRSYSLWSRYYVKELRKAYEMAARRGDLSGTLARFTRPSTRAMLRWVVTGTGDWFKRGEFHNRRGYSGPALWAALQELVRSDVLEERGAGKGREYRLRSGFLSDVYGRLA